MYLKLFSIFGFFAYISSFGTGPRKVDTLVIITGGNGVLGKALIEESVNRNYEVVCGYRNFSRCFNALKHLSIPISMYPCDMHNTDFSDFIENLKIKYVRESNEMSIVLINNAAICTGDSTLEALQESLYVNCVGPIRLSFQLADFVR